MPVAPAATPRLDFPLASPGYDPRVVEAYLDAVAHALADLLAVAPSEIIERARRLGLVGPDTDTPDVGAPTEAPPHENPSRPLTAEPCSSTLDGVGPDPDSRGDEALRAEAALVVIETARAMPSP
jgi:hypothetical protein